MKHLKLLGLAAIAALGLMAFVGAGTASATTLCKTNESPKCKAGWAYPAGTSLHASLVPKTSASLTSPAKTVVATCTGVTLTASLEKESAPVLVFNIHTLDWTGCNTTVSSNTSFTGKLTVKWLKENEAEVTADETRVTVVLSGLSCTYTAGGGTKLGTIKGGSEPILKIETTVEFKEGSFACPKNPIWDAEFVITEPKPIFATE
jgi:hypothetical protein